MSIDKEIAEAIAQIQTEQISRKEQLKTEVQKILHDDLFAMAEFDDDEKLCFYLRSRFIKVCLDTSADYGADFMSNWDIYFFVDGKAQIRRSCSGLLRPNLINAIATVEIAEAKANHEFEKLPLHQKFWQFLQTFWK